MPLFARIAGSDANGSGTTSVTAAFGQTTITGSLLVAIVYGSGATGTNAISGWTLSAEAPINANGASISIFHKISAGDSTAAISGSGTLQWHLYEYAAALNPVVLDANGTTGNGTTGVGTLVGPPMTFPARGLLITACGTSASNGGSTSWSASTLLQGNTQNRIIAGQNFAGALNVSAFTSTASWATNRPPGIVSVAFKHNPDSAFMLFFR